MSEETMEPRTFEDLWLMRETSNAWFAGQLSYEDVRKGADPEVGMVDGVSWHVAPCSDRVRVCRNTHKWWDLTMEKFAGGDADASWLRTVELDGEEVEADPAWIGYGPSAYVEMGVGSQYRDWLGNVRQDKGHDTLSIHVERMSGKLWLRCGEHEVEGTVKEIEEAMTLVERLRDLGIKVGDESIKVPLPKTNEEAGKYGDR